MSAIPSMSVPVSGHFWTIAPNLFPSLARLSSPFATTVQDPFMGSVQLSGLFEDVPNADTVALIVHGFAGNAGSPYCGFAARAARAAGYASLRLSLRGADLTGEDIYHGGLTSDLQAALRAPELKRYRNVMLIGYSVGGCLALRAAIEKIDPRIRGVVAVCSPIDLEAGADAFDAPERSFYRQQVFNGLNRVYAATNSRRGLPTLPTSCVVRVAHASAMS